MRKDKQKQKQSSILLNKADRSVSIHWLYTTSPKTKKKQQLQTVKQDITVTGGFFIFFTFNWLNVALRPQKL